MDMISKKLADVTLLEVQKIVFQKTASLEAP
jgi:hypothetical protein